MKKIASLLLSLLLIMCVLLSVPMTVSAESTATEDGLTVTITTDKDEYAQDEDIQVVISITNNNSYRVEGISVETLLPEGLIVKGGTLSIQKIAINAGETYTVSVLAGLSEELWVEIVDPTDPNASAGEQGGSSNGNNSKLIWIIAASVGAVAILGVAIFLIIKKKKATKLTSFILCLLMVTAILPLSVFAEGGKTVLYVDKTIVINGNEYTINSTIEKPINSTPEENDVFVATFAMNDGSDGTYQVQTIPNGEMVKIPEAPTRLAYDFTGWYIDAECTTPFDFSTIISQNITLYAGWTVSAGVPEGTSSSSGGGTTFSISSIEMQGNSVVATINADDPCILHIQFLDENTDSIITTVSTVTPRYCEMTPVSVPIGTALPSKYVIVANLVDVNGERLCNPLTCMEYTTAYENFAKQTIHDFEDKTVINFDENENKNFGVLSDDIIHVATSDTTNKVTVLKQPIASVDDDEETEETEYIEYYTFNYPDEQISNLAVGDKLYIPSKNALIKVGAIEVTHTGAIVVTASNDVELSDFYDVLNVNMEMDVEDVEEDEDIPSTMSTIVDDSFGTGLNFSINYSPQNAEWLKVEGSFNVNATVKIKVVYDIKWFEKDYYYVSVVTEMNHKIDIDIKASLNNDAAIDAAKEKRKIELPLGKFAFPTTVPGLVLSITPTIPFEIELSGGLSFEVTYKSTSGFSYTSYDGKQNIEKKEHKVQFDLEAGVEIKFGPKIEIALGFCGSVIKGSLTVAAGIHIEAEVDFLNLETGDSVIHACGLCVDGDVGIYFEAKAGLSYKLVKYILEGDLGKWTIIKLERSIGDFHISIANDADSLYGGRLTFGWGDCENNKYKTQFVVKDLAGDTIPNVTVTIKKANGDVVTSASTSDRVYLYNGSYIATATVGGVEASKDFTIYLGGRTVELVIESSGTLSGRICKASDRVTAISNATIQIYRNGVLYTTRYSNSSGNYSINLPAGQYFVVITADGYINFSSNATVTADQNTYMETFLMIQGEEGDEGIASGKVVNSLTGQGAPNVSLVILKNWNSTMDDGEVVGTATTDSSGNYSIELPIGNYTVVASKDDYTSSSFNIIVQNGTTSNQNGTITPIIAEGSGGNYLITLTWGSSPSDLDSHLVGEGSHNFHVYFSNQTYSYGGQTICNLDYDDTSSYGPEHVTLIVDEDDVYYYYIYNYSSSYGMTTSGAKITVEQNNVKIAEFNVPTDLSDARYWNVFAIKDGRIIVKNTITSTADTSYAD